MQLVLITQYFDTIKTIGESDKTNTPVPVPLAGRGERHLPADHGVDAGGQPGQGRVAPPLS
ncbi:MAG: hypothetical protein WDN45_07220 [Caulobacteraceae bacterium]